MDKENFLSNNKIFRIRESSKMAGFMVSWRFTKLGTILIRGIFIRERSQGKVPYYRKLIRTSMIKINLGKQVIKAPGEKIRLLTSEILNDLQCLSHNIFNNNQRNQFNHL